MTDTTKRAAIYTRVSDRRQVKGNGLHDQLEACRRYAAQNGFTIIQEFTEGGYTGKVLNRPEFDRLKALAGTVDAVIFYLQDRISRADELETVNLMRWFDDHGTEVHTTNRGRIDTRNFGSLIMAFADGYQSREWREKHIERVRSSLHTNAQNGKIGATRVDRYGFRYIPKSQGGPCLELVEDERQTVVDMYTWIALGDESGKKLSMEAIAHKLTVLGIPTAYDRTEREAQREDKPRQRGIKSRGRGVWGLSTVRQIIRNPIYKGEAHFGKTRVEWYEDENGLQKQRQVPTAESEWKVIHVPPIVSPDLWELAQKQADINSVRSPRRVGKGKVQNEYLLRHMMTCSRCGLMVYCVSEHGRLGYRCGGRHRHNSPDGQTVQCHGGINTPELDRRAWAAVKAFILDPSQLREGHEEQRGKRNAKRSALQKRQRDALRQAAEAQQARDILLEVRLSGRIPKDEFEKRDDKLKAKLAELETELQTLDYELSKAEASTEARREVIAYCARIARGIETVTFEEKRAILEALNIIGKVQRGEKRADDVLILTGNITPLRIPLPGDGRRPENRFAALSLFPCDAKASFPITFVIPLPKDGRRAA